MDWLNAILRHVVGVFAVPPIDLHPLVGLTILSIAVGILMLWVFGKVSDQDRILTTKKLVQAYLLELRLYGDDPALIWKSQTALILANFRYMGSMLKPAVYLTVPMVILLFHLDAFYGMKPLPVGESVVVTVQVNGAVTPDTQAPKLRAPAGVRVETPAVRAVEPGQFSWRIRPEQPVRGVLSFDWEKNGFWEKSIAAGDELQLLSVRRVGTWYETVWNPGEDRIEATSVAWVEILYPAATIEWAGIDLHWLIWFLVLSIVPAYLLKDYFGVTL